MYIQTGVFEGGSTPPEYDVNYKVKDGQEHECTAAHDQYERERPEILVQRDHSFILLTLTQHQTQPTLHYITTTSSLTDQSGGNLTRSRPHNRNLMMILYGFL